MLRRIVPALVVLFAPAVAWAANGNKPRIVPLWSESTCATVVDRSSTPMVHVDYTIVEEDVPEMRTADEVDDSRTHQFFAFRRLDYAAAASSPRLPVWITQADIDRAAAVDPAVQEMVTAGIDPAEILAGGPRFAASDWTRITPDDARVPISFEQAAMGVDWDISAVEPGAWTIWGYTWEAPLNTWAVRTGFVKVIASAAEADAAGPAIALVEENVQLAVGEPHPLSGCVDAPAGSTLTLEWGAVEGTVEPEWQPLVEDEPVATGPLDVELVLPEEAADGSGLVKLRATVRDPGGRAYVAYSFGSYAVMGGAGSDSDGGEDGGGGGCCSVAGPVPPSTVALVLGTFALVRRRRQR